LHQTVATTSIRITLSKETPSDLVNLFDCPVL